jgi:transcriptional regulator GlxA family with amidase domain
MPPTGRTRPRPLAPSAAALGRLRALALAVALLGPPPTARAAAAAIGAPPAPPLTPPATGKIRVAFLISDGANVIDLAGPWEVFQDVHVHGRGATMAERMPFALFAVAETRAAVRLTGGLRVVPDATLGDASAPQVVVVPAMRGSARVHDGLRRVAPRADQVMSVCTGAFQLARAGLLDGLAATTHHDSWDEFERTFPRVRLVRGERYVESSARVATAGGLTSGIDLALRVVERYFGREVAAATARYLEHRGRFG